MHNNTPAERAKTLLFFSKNKAITKIIIKDVGLNYFRIGLIDVLMKMNAKIKITNGVNNTIKTYVKIIGAFPKFFSFTSQ